MRGKEGRVETLRWNGGTLQKGQRKGTEEEWCRREEDMAGLTGHGEN